MNSCSSSALPFVLSSVASRAKQYYQLRIRNLIKLSQDL